LDGESARHKAATYTGQYIRVHSKTQTDIDASSGFESMIPVFEGARIIIIIIISTSDLFESCINNMY
jgi:hypothetical protein